MALFNPTFIFGWVVLLYLSSFVLFAILRILTGISIQRIGYFSVRRVAYVPRDGFKIEIRGLGLNVHRPTFAQPTWLSIVIDELVVTVDYRELEGVKATAGGSDDGDSQDGKDTTPPSTPSRASSTRRSQAVPARSETWKQLTRLKDRFKRLHRNINWLRMVDVVATNSTLNVVDVGSIQVGSFTVGVDTRRKMVDRARFFFQGKSEKRREQQQAEWILTLKSVLFTVDQHESMEVLESATINIHGYLYEALDGLRDAAVAVKVGRVHLPLDDIKLWGDLHKLCRRQAVSAANEEEFEDISVDQVIQELDTPGSTNDGLVQTVSDSKEFISSILRGVKEVQFAVSYVGLTKKVEAVKTAGGTPVLLHASMKELGIDLHRLDPKSPAHRMYFPSKDIAHEALAAALSISIGIDDGHGKPQRIMYIPMATTTVKTTLPSKTVEIARERSADEKNANILFANSVVTSPSIDLDPKHLPLVLAILRPKPKARKSQPEGRHVLISRLLPKANIKFTMHEPVIRVALPPVQETGDPDDFDLIISSISSVSLDVESFHSAIEDLHYSLASTVRVQSHNLYYHTSGGARFDLLETESFELKVQLSATPEVHVMATGTLQTFSIKMVRPEISDGLRQIVRQLRLNVEPDKRAVSKIAKHPNFLRAMPDWLLHFHLQASEFSLEVAGVDDDISDDTRGVAVQLDSWSAEYRAQRLDRAKGRPNRKRASSRTMLSPDNELLKSVPVSPRKKHHHDGDGRRIAIHGRLLEAFVVESSERWEIEPFVNVPRFEVAFSTLSDHQGPMFHINSHVRTLLLHYSLYRHYAVGVATMVLRKAFMRTSKDTANPRGTPPPPAVHEVDLLSPPQSPDPFRSQHHHDSSNPAREFVTVDVKAALVQIKADMPNDPPMMLQLYNLEAGRHRWSPPFFQSKLIRLYAEAPRMRSVWARIISIKNGRLEYRESRKRTAVGGLHEDRVVDIVTDAIRAAVPHELVFHKITDNFINVFKSVQQLHHRFKTGTNEYILEKGPEGPKHIPKISLRSKTFLFELEDGAFEWKLGMIYRAGRVEQMQRLAREEAFRVKVKKIHEQEARKDGSRYRNRSLMTRGRSAHSGHAWGRSHSEDSRPRSSTEGHVRGRTPRYDPDGGSQGMTGTSHVSIAEARYKLNLHNAESWKKRIDRHYMMARNGMSAIRDLFFGHDQLPDDVEDQENILEIPPRPALMSALINSLHFTIDKPSFAMKELPEFLHKVGKGMPKDMQYSLLIPMHVQIEMGEAKLSLRDYPLPLLHVPGMKSGQPSRLPSLSLKTNFVIAEEFRGPESTRKVRVNIIPPRSLEPGCSNEGSFAIDVRRTVGAVKSFSDMYIDINTALPTRITWGPSYQPAVQDMMMVIESFTKPQIDISDRVGFWDKIRLNFHSRVRVAWKGDGDVHLALKGTRDPYQVTGNGAGFLMCWRNDVRWNIHVDDDPKRFMTVDSGEYVLAVPDYSHHAREVDRSTGDDETKSDNSHKSSAAFKKVVMKLSGKVQWLAGLVFERAIESGKRNFEFTPHYDVVLKMPAYAKTEDGSKYDAFRGFRSQHIHMSVAVRAPVDRDWTSSNPEPSRSYNTVHLTPRFFTHFFAWWSLFGGPLSLPIRQGNLWPGREKNSKKFGRHLATIKYNLLLAPLFLSHIYKHKDVEDYSEDAVSATGIKVRFDSFMLDLHQRREEFNLRDRGRKNQSRTTGMKIHAGQLDLVSADVRAVSASIKGTSSEALRKHSVETFITQQAEDGTDLSRFTIPDNDFTWIDMDDFVELDWILPTEPNPDTQILPLAYAPRVTYFRQTDIDGVIDGDPDRTSPFGDEPTHFCIMRHEFDPRRVQNELIQKRLDQLRTQMEAHTRNLGEAELRMVRDDYRDPTLKTDFDALSKHSTVLQDKKAFLEQMSQEMEAQIAYDSHRRASEAGRKEPASDTSVNIDEGQVSIPAGAEFVSDFKNRFVVHNIHLKWNNLLRNIILRYTHQVSQRRGFVYYLSRPAVKFILDIVEEQARSKAARATNGASSATGGSAATQTPDNNHLDRETTKDIEDRIRKILQDGKKYVNADDSSDPDSPQNISMEDLTSGIADGFTPQNSYHVRLIAPQIQLQSEKNKKHVVLLTSKGMELKVVEVVDKERISDNVSGLVQRRFLVNMDSTQFFVTHQKWFSTQLFSMYSGSTYGSPLGSSWPPWVPTEVMFDFQTDPFGFKRVVQKTSAMLRYEKYNTLRLKYDDEVNTGEGPTASNLENGENKMDNLWVEFPQARALCNSSQYYAIYVIVLDLLLYSEPLEKTRSERLEKIMLASDFSDLRGAPEMVTRLQERIRQLEDIKNHFQIHSKYLDKKGWQDRLLLERDLSACEDELFFMMKAITTSQGRHDSAQSNALLKWSITAKEIVWQLMRDNNEPLVELQLKDMEYDRTDNSDGSHINLFRVGKVLGLNLLNDAIYPQMIAPYIDERSPADLDTRPMISIYWNMLEAIAGIPVMDHFEVSLVPLKIQLEREVGKRLFEYIFPGMEGDKTGNGRDDSPFIVKPMDDDDGDDDTTNASMGRVAMGGSEQDLEAGNFMTRAGSLELRLRPTLTSNPQTIPIKQKALSIHSTEGHSFRFFRSATGSKSLGKKASQDSLRAGGTPRPGVPRSSTGFSSRDASSTNSDSKKVSRFLRSKGNDDKDDKPSDDLTKMITRASNYMTFSHIKMGSVVLCLSYKGKGDRSIVDVHDFVFRLPSIEYRNKTWSNLDLALAFKSRVIKALISHTGAIIGNKFSKHRPNTAQQSKLRELATSSMLLATPSMSESRENSGDDSSSIFGTSPVDFSRSPPRSLHGSQSSIPRPSSISRSSSVASSRSHRSALPPSSNNNGGGGGGVPKFLMMTPPGGHDNGKRRPSDQLRPASSSSSSVNQYSVTISGGSHNEQNERRKSTIGGMREKLSAFTSRLKDREPSNSGSGSGGSSSQTVGTPGAGQLLAETRSLRRAATSKPSTPDIQEGESGGGDDDDDDSFLREEELTPINRDRDRSSDFVKKLSKSARMKTG
ncbi:uncharacterized protein E0L32_009325 [Thyridium curvatum]|uniref:Uncharacterized protein n=1 Tax=Thyridium curvatum TaxID=1093900 RepID=A0A507APV9_9PEZI|nr:uncharacterized protein E0L32_009325 [Thyridium curvatum]TPX09437.1 hypothetical protein E0L32_009325 [Thyridium curvatum]